MYEFLVNFEYMVSFVKVFRYKQMEEKNFFF